ncbi:MAG: hypothetical protein IJX53_06050 [Clostridia bacterium]|nr:hypothetical protein [Clostridia bacterium]
MPLIYQSAHTITLADGTECQIHMTADEDFVVFETTPPLGPDLSLLGLDGERRTIFYSIEDGRLWLDMIWGEFRRRPFRSLPAIDGVEAVQLCTVESVPRCENPRMWGYGFVRPSDFSGTMLIGRDFNMRFWPENEYTERVPCNPEVYRVVERLIFTDGRLTGRERVKQTN